MRVGFIGLGHMGQHMATNILQAGHDVTVYDLDPVAMERLSSLGAKAASTVPELALACECVITMLPGPVQVQQVVGGTDGLIANLKAGSTWIDMSTSSPELGRQLAKLAATRDILQLDAPVSGMVKGAEDGTLQIFVGGDKRVFDQMLPLLEAMGDNKRIFLVGPLGAGHTVKLLLNLLWFVHAAAAAEVFVMGVSAGIELDTLQRSLVASPANSHFIETDINSVFNGDYDESFAMKLVCKDLGLAVDMGRDLDVPVELSALVEQINRRALLAYGSDGGEMLAVKLLEDLTHTYLRHENGQAN